MLIGIIRNPQFRLFGISLSEPLCAAYQFELVLTCLIVNEHVPNKHHDPVKLLRATVHSKKAVKEKRDRVSCGLLLQKSRLGYDPVVLAG